MTRTKWIWLIVVLVYAAFFYWYTSFGGPLNEKEIAYYSERFESLEPPPPPEAVARLRQFMEEDTGDDFVMVNVIDMYETHSRSKAWHPAKPVTTSLRNTWRTCSRRFFRGPLTRFCMARRQIPRWTS